LCFFFCFYFLYSYLFLPLDMFFIIILTCRLVATQRPTKQTTRQRPVNSSGVFCDGCRDVINNCVRQLSWDIWLVSELVGQLESYWSSVFVRSCSEKLVAQAGDSSGTQRKLNVLCWKPPPRNGHWTYCKV
jgi:hypothetical protein